MEYDECPARLYLTEARQLVADGKCLTAEQAYFDAIRTALAHGDDEVGSLFVANARLSDLYAATLRVVESRCCALEALMLAHRVFDVSARKDNPQLDRAMKNLESRYICDVDSKARLQDGHHRYTPAEMRRNRVINGLFPREPAAGPSEVGEYRHLLTFRYNRDIIHDSLVIPKIKTRKNRGGARRSKKIKLSGTPDEEVEEEANDGDNSSTQYRLDNDSG